MCLGFAQSATAGSLKKDAQAGAQFCFPMVESHQANPEYLTKQGFVAKNARYREFNKHTVENVTWNDGTVHQRKNLVGAVKVMIPGFGKSVKGTTCTVELPGDADLSHAIIPMKKRRQITAGEKAVIEAFIAAAAKRGYKYQKDGNRMYFLKGDIRIHASLGVSPSARRQIVLSVQRSY